MTRFLFTLCAVACFLAIAIFCQVKDDAPQWRWNGKMEYGELSFRWVGSDLLRLVNARSFNAR